jgi:membrane-associated phospholipid phosphatase
MHIAQTLILLWAIKKGLPRIFSLSAIYELLLLISTLFFGWHYLVDDLAGILVAYVAIKASIKLENEKSEPIMSLVKELREKAEDGEDYLTKELETAKARITKQNQDL